MNNNTLLIVVGIAALGVGVWYVSSKVDQARADVRSAQASIDRAEAQVRGAREDAAPFVRFAESVESWVRRFPR